MKMFDENIDIRAVQCPSCLDIIYSRARHDLRECSCGSTFVDGGLDYLRYGGKIKPTIIEMSISATAVQLYEDWNTKTDKYGSISHG